MRAMLLLTAALIVSAPAIAQQAPAQSMGAITRQPWSMRGLNAGVQDALQGFPKVMTAFPGMNAIRLNANPGKDSASSIGQVVREYTGAGVVVEIEDHSGHPNNVAWYRQMARQYKANPLVFLEMPNEPNAAGLVDIQIGLINTIRAAGFTNPIGIQPAGGWDFSNVGPVVAALGTTGLFVTPHIYYAGSDPNGAAAYVQRDLQLAKQLGLFAVIDEFGNAMDGFTLDPYGDAVIRAVIAANEGGQAGAVFWAMNNGNHPDGADSAFLKPDGSALTTVGRQIIQPWLRSAQPNDGTSPAPSGRLTPVPAAGLADVVPSDPVATTGGGMIGMTFCPGKTQRHSVSSPWARGRDLDHRFPLTALAGRVCHSIAGAGSPSGSFDQHDQPDRGLEATGIR